MMNEMLLRRRVAKMEPLPDFEKMYLTFVMLEDSVVKFNYAISYSTDDGETWTTLSANTNSPTFTAGQRVLWKNSRTPAANYGVGTFTNVSGSYNVEGNVMSVLHGDSFYTATTLKGGQTFRTLFKNNKGIRNASHMKLPLTTLDKGQCYQDMFLSSSITHAPELPATTLSSSCYRSMFESCSSLIACPKLPAVTLKSYCYNSMFYGCTLITESPILTAEVVPDSAYYYMFGSCTNLKKITCLATDRSATNATTSFTRGVAATGTFVKSPNMTSWPRNINGIPSGWTVEDYTG